jgi:signal peptidase I
MSAKKNTGKMLEMRAEEKEKKPLLSDKAKKEIREWVVSLTSAAIVVLLVSNFLCTIIRVDGGSMLNTLHDGDRLYVNVLDMKRNGPERYDVVILHYPDRRGKFVKRVIGLPGDALEVKEGVLYVNGEAVEEAFLAQDRTVRFSKSANNMAPTVVPEGQYFVMGDNRDNSNDSRNVGFITEDMFVGKVRYIIWPLDRIGEVADSFIKEADGVPFLAEFTFGEYGFEQDGCNSIGGLMLSFTALG